MTRAARRPVSRHTSRVPQPSRVAKAPQAQGIPTPITEIPHLAEAARRRGETNRVIRVDAPQPQQVRTPGRRVGQWLSSGEPLSPPAPQYITPAEIAEIERGDIWEGGFDR